MYPYFIYPAVMALRKGVDDPEEAMRLRRIVAANVGDLPSLRLMLGIDPEEFASFYPDMGPATPSTADTIDTFINRFGQKDPGLPKTTEDIPISISSVGLPDSEFSEPTEQDARNLIKIHDYQGALEIIQQLSLNIPEKSIYFADQIRFLKKLILNQSYSSSNKASSNHTQQTN